MAARSIRCRPFDLVNDDELARDADWLEFQPELLLQRGKDGWRLRERHRAVEARTTGSGPLGVPLAKALECGLIGSVFPRKDEPFRDSGAINDARPELVSGEGR